MQARNSTNLNVVTIILARGGSKELHKKNIRLVSGRPLISYAIEASLSCDLVDRTLVSTDDEEISDIASQWGAEVPYRRPSELAQDYSNAEIALVHMVDWLRDNEKYEVDIVAYVQVTDIFKKRYMLEACIRSLLDEPGVDTAFVGYRHHKNYWIEQEDSYKKITFGGNTARQIKEPVFREDTGLGCATRVSVLRSGRRIGDNVVIVPTEDFVSSIDIHNEFDLWLAETILNSGRHTIND